VPNTPDRDPSLLSPLAMPKPVLQVILTYSRLVTDQLSQWPRPSFITVILAPFARTVAKVIETNRGRQRVRGVLFLHSRQGL